MTLLDKKENYMTELLAPAGNMEALKAAIANGCDAIYLGMQKFGARAYSSNFDIDTIKEAVDYAHLRGVRVYVTMNTIVFEDEMAEMEEQLCQLNEIGMDGVIVQDLAVFNYIVEHFVDMEAHCSTQMGLDDLDGALLFKELGARRVVLSRELPVEKVKAIRDEARIPVEIFVHGALCVSYSGNCLMSGLIGYRSGNRGRCVGSCRKKYELVERNTGESFGGGYLLSTKDLNTLDRIEDLKEIDSLKIEGRMKEPAYVANVVSKYRAALDGQSQATDYDDLRKTFNRTFTKGYLFHEDVRDISNIQKPNNYGFEIGSISAVHNGIYEIELNEGHVLNQNDIIRIDHNNEDVNCSVVKLYDRGGNLIKKSKDYCYIKLKEQLSVGDIVYKTKDYYFYKDLDDKLEGEFQRFKLNLKVYAYPGSKLVIDAEGLGQQFLYESEDVLEQSKTSSATKEQIVKHLSKLNDTVFVLGEVEFEEYGAFIPAKLLNNARREIVQKLYEAKLASKKRATKDAESRSPIVFEKKAPYITASVQTEEQYNICKRLGIEDVYYDNIIRRNQNEYEDKEGELLIGGYGGIHHYNKTNSFVTDYSLNVVNAESCYELYKLGAKRVTLSYELNKKQIGDLVESYYDENGGYPALEMIVYGRAPLMFTKYCPLKKMNLCGRCKTGNYELRDEYGEFPIISHEDCTTTILNGKILNLLDEMPDMKNIEAFRLNFTIESAKETGTIVSAAIDKINGRENKSLFNAATDTRGHYNREIM